MLIKILIVIAALIALVFVIAAFRPDSSRITRTATFTASPAALFAQVNDLHAFHTWNPWAALDPEMKTSYDGPAAGVNASQSWSGNSKVGVGRMTIIESQPNELLRMRLDFEKPMASTSTAEFTFKPEGGKTVMTWSMYGKTPYMAKVVGLFMNMDKMVGGAFEQGMATLRTKVEAPAAK